MSVQIVAIVVSLAVTAVALVMTAQAVRSILATVRAGQPADRSGNAGARFLTMLKETVGHTRMLQWSWIGVLHWWVFAAFLFLSTAVAAGYVQLFKADFVLPVVGHWYIYEWVAELLGLFGTLGIIGLIIYRQTHHPRTLGRKSRFFGSNFAQAYFVEFMVLLESAAILFIRGAEYKLLEGATKAHFPLSWMVGELFYPSDPDTLRNIIYVVAMIKIVSAMVWLMVISRNLEMGIAWHRFTAWFNIYFKRESSGGTALGALKPLTIAGKPVTLDDIEDMDEDSVLGVGRVEDFSWKGLLDFTTCTECGRCQSQCPAWNTEKPLSPKLVITALRDHTYAKAPYLKANEADRERMIGEGSSAAGDTLVRELERPLIGDTGDEWFYMPEDGTAVISEDALWSCTTCGACVQQCPVDIEHVDHIVDMRRYQILVESNFPAELGGLFKGLESKGNPWNMAANARLDWAKVLEFDVPVLGEDVESLDDVEWLFWVGCAGAYEDRAKKTTRAVAELLHTAGVSFAVLGSGETCTGDPARRAGNEFVFQGLAAQNVETLTEFKAKKVVSTCAHCFNTLKNEYKQFGIELEVTHHTQLLNRLVREGRLTPIKDGIGAAKRSITYHDPCYLGRHNQVYEAPRELLQILPGAEFKEMPRNQTRSFCCGAGGARMWMEERLGERINMNRTEEAVATGADQIAVGCPFCRVMLSDGLTAAQAKGEAREEVEVLDVAQMLLASVKGESATKLAPGGAPSAPATAGGAATAAAAGAAAVAAPTETPVEADAPAPAAESGGSLFDTAPAESGGSLFDAAPAEAPAPAEAAPDAGGSLFDVPAAEPAAPAAAEPAGTSPAATTIPEGSSLFDLGGEAPAASSEPAVEPAPGPAAEAAPAPAGVSPVATAIPEGESLFDVAQPEAAAAPQPASADSSAPAAAAAVSAKATPIPEGESLFPATSEQAPAVDTQTAQPAQTAQSAAPATAVAAAPVSPVATTIPEGGSLFDIETPAAPAAEAAPAPAAAPAEAAPAAPAAPPAAPAVPAPAAAAPTPAPVATSIPEGGSLFDIETPAAPAAPAAAPAEPAPEAGADPAPTEAPAAPQPPAAAPTPVPVATSIPEGSLFDIEAPAAPETPAAEPEATEPVTAAPAEPEPAPEPAPTPATAVEPTPQPAVEADPDRATHSPRTDADIHGSSSLFDL